MSFRDWWNYSKASKLDALHPVVTHDACQRIIETLESQLDSGRELIEFIVGREILVRNGPTEVWAKRWLKENAKDKA